MLHSVLNRCVLMGAVCACVWSWILPLVPLRIELVRIGVAELEAHGALSQQEKLSILLFGVCAAVLLLAPLGIGWFVAQMRTGARGAAKLSITARGSAFGGASAVAWGMLPLTVLIVFWNVARVVLAGDLSGMLAWLLVYFVAVGLGALGGTLYFWLRGRRYAVSLPVVPAQTVGGPHATS